jgi:hypothetical protein
MSRILAAFVVLSALVISVPCSHAVPVRWADGNGHYYEAFTSPVTLGLRRRNQPPLAGCCSLLGTPDWSSASEMALKLELAAP